MIKFEEHDGMIFKMLEEPVPLTPDAEMPCLVHLIHDDSPMGKHNKDLHGFDSGRLTPKICTEVIDVNDLSDPNRGNARCDGFMSIQYYRYELIGTFVEEGSDDWALYQMMNGEKICHYKSPSIMYCEHAGYIRREVRYNCVDHMSVSVWLNGADKNGWQIYVEPEQPKPLLADAQVGDLCKHRNGDWSQIIDTNGTYILGQPIRTTLKDSQKINRNFCLSGHHFTMQFGGEYDIIHWEPLAQEGSAEWALQMLLLGKKVTKQHLHDSGNVYWCFCDRPRCVQEFNCGTLQIMVTPEIWVKTVDKCGWRIYAEPKPESQRKGYGIKDLKPDNLYLNIKPSTPADWCFDKKNLLVLVDNNFKGIVGENVTREQVGEIAKLLTEPKPESENIIHGHIPADMHLKYFHLHEFKVGDWVEFIDVGGHKSQGKYLSKAFDNAILVRDITYNTRCIVPTTKIIRKLKPSEVVLHFGSGISGTIKRWDSTTFHIFHGNSKFSKIHIDALDAPTREFVESLLKAQDEEK